MRVKFWVAAGLLAVGLVDTAGAQHTAIFPQVAVGGNYSTRLAVADPNGVPSSTKTITVELYDDFGSGFPVSVNGGPPQSTFTITLNRFEERVLTLTSSGSVKAGWMRLSSTGPGRFDASIQYIQWNGPPESGTPLDAVGVLPTDNVHEWTIGIDKRNLADNVGVAISNPSNTNSIEVVFDLFKNGNRFGTTVRRSISALGHLAAYVNEIMGTTFIDVGTLVVRTNPATNFNVVSLNQNGSEFSSLPAFKAGALWNWSSPPTGPNAGGQWSWSFLDNGTFYGVEKNTIGITAEVFMRGFLLNNRFMAERLFDGGGSRGVVLYQGTLDSQGRTINGTMLIINENGVVTANQTLRATRVD